MERLIISSINRVESLWISNNRGRSEDRNGQVRSRLANDDKTCTYFTNSYTEYVFLIQKLKCLGKKFPGKKTTTGLR